MKAEPPAARLPRSQIAVLLTTSASTSMAMLALTTVLGLIVYRITGSELDLGLLGLAEFAPAALLVVVAGNVVDRFDTRRVAAAGATTEAVFTLMMAWHLHHPGRVSILPIYLLVLGYGTGQAFLSPALRSVPPSMVPDDRVAWLIARRNVAQQGAMIVGPVLGGFLYGAGNWVPLVTVAALAGITAPGALLLRLLPHPVATGAGRPGASGVDAVRPGAESAEGIGEVRDEEVGHVLEEGIPASRGGLHEAMAGLRFVRSEPILLGAISLDLFAVLLGGAVTLLPAIAARLHTGAVGLGWLRAATGIGAGIMTVLISFRPVQRRVGKTLFGVVAIFGIWTIVLGVTRSYALAFISILALSAADAVSMFIRSTLVPMATPPEMRGRVLAVENVFIGASNELGGFESGVIGQLLGTTGSVVLGGFGTLVVALSWAALFPRLRKLDRFPTSAEAAQAQAQADSSKAEV